MGYWAHTAGANGEWHALVEHSLRVGELAGAYGDRIGVGALARAVGLLHDVGKYRPEFQKYLQDAASNGSKRLPGQFVDHKRTSTRLATETHIYLAHFILGHHGGLLAKDDVGQFLEGHECRDFAAGIAHLDEVRSILERVPPAAKIADEYQALVKSRLDEDLFVRMAYSCLVDADATDTAEHFEGGDRAGPERPAMGELQKRLSAAHKKLTCDADDTPVNRVRGDVHKSCLRAGDWDPGLFRLTVPTGGGKTLSSLAFALSHALAHGLDRVIYVIPYTSIIEQTAEVFRNAIGPDAVLEHHSSLRESAPGREAEDGDVDRWSAWHRIAQENWDSPVVVTTSVQFFESLFSSRPGRCRKLHRIARSVVILDEAQTLPIPLRAPIDDMILSLSERYGTSFVLCTATQPSFEAATRYVGGGLGLREIVEEPSRHFKDLRRVRYEIEQDLWSWEQVAEHMSAEPQCLTILNSRKDALSLLDVLDSDGAFHLSTLMCVAHRRDVLKEIGRRLKAGEVCRVVSTQVVEAGVDIDFPCVFRAVGPLDSIIQAAGRCNREGHLQEGRMTVFFPEEQSTPLGVYRSAIELTTRKLNDEHVDLHDAHLFEQYSAELMSAVQQDPHDVQARRLKLDFPDVDKRFQMITDDTTQVLIPHDVGVFEKLERAMSDGYLDAGDRRLLQQYSISLRRYELDRFIEGGLVTEARQGSGLFTWVGVYDSVRGIGYGVEEPSRFVI